MNWCCGQAHTRLLVLSMFNVSIILILSDDDKRQIRYLEAYTLGLNLDHDSDVKSPQSFFLNLIR